MFFVFALILETILQLMYLLSDFVELPFRIFIFVFISVVNAAEINLSANSTFLTKGTTPENFLDYLMLAYRALKTFCEELRLRTYIILQTYYICQFFTNKKLQGNCCGQYQPY